MTVPTPGLAVHTLSVDDGTTLGYRSVGDGPGLVVLHGAMSTGAYHRDLADLLADRFTVHLPDRRGRGLSGPRRPGDGHDRDVVDLLALLEITGARDVFAVSSGAIVALTAALRNPDAFGRLVVNEPPFIPAERAQPLVAELRRRLERGDLAGALVTGMKGGELGPAALNRVPDRLLALMIRPGLNSPMVKGADYPTMAALAPTLADDFAVVAEAGADGVERFAGLRLPLTCVTGTKSPGYLRGGMRELSRVVPGARLVELPDVGHDVSWNRELRGHPDLVADAVRQALPPE